MARVLFLLKRRDPADTGSDSAGLFAGASLSSDMLIANRIDSRVSVLQDSSSIEQEIIKYDPTHILIENLWAEPEVIAGLQSRYPHISFLIRLHGDIVDITANDHAMSWISSYDTTIAVANPVLLRELRKLLRFELQWTKKQAETRVISLPVSYSQSLPKLTLDKDKSILDIGCFGTLEPHGNHLVQAAAALELAVKQKTQLHFHVQQTQGAGSDDPTLLNLQRIFDGTMHDGHLLIVHPWAPRSSWLDMCAQMDIGMQATHSSLGDQLAADLIVTGVPIVHSYLPWGGSLWRADPDDSHDIATKLSLAQELRWINVVWHQFKLRLHNLRTRRAWLAYLKDAIR
jgi:hypothetical protein